MIWTCWSLIYKSKMIKQSGSKKQITHHVVFPIAGHSISNAVAVICYEKQVGLKRIEQFNQINAGLCHHQRSTILFTVQKIFCFPKD